MISNIIYAVDSDGNLAHIDDVPNGLKCGCVCPSCGVPLVAKNGGSKMGHHFAHSNGADCATGYQTSIHLLAKEIIQESKKIYIPTIGVWHYYRVPRVEKKYSYLTQSAYTTGTNCFKVREISFDPHNKDIYREYFRGGVVENQVERVELEQSEGDIIPDIVVYFQNGTRLFVEIYVTHKVDGAKEAKLREKGVSCIEVDLSSVEKTITKAELAGLLYDKKFMDEHCRWVYNQKIGSLKRQFIDFVSKNGTWIPFNIKESNRGTGTIWYFTYGCPANGYRLLDGFKYTDFYDSCCLSCPCCCGAVPCDEAYYGLPEQIKAFCIYKAFRRINSTFNLGMGIQCDYKNKVISTYEEVPICED